VSESFIGQIIPVAFDYAPVGWLPCDGRVLAIDQYPVLFQLIGTTYGGDGQSNFAVPNLSGQVAVGMGQGNNLQPYAIGQTAGSETVTLTDAQLASHTHAISASTANGTASVPGPSNTLAVNTATGVPVYSAAPPAATMAAAAISQVGGSQPHENRQPYLVINYIIATDGIYPSSG
jgi:microcystin-dependent protein